MDSPDPQDRHRHIDAIVRAVFKACEPSACLQRWLHGHPSTFRRPAVLAIGKAAAAMFDGWRTTRGEPEAQLVIIPAGADGQPWMLRGEHPLPGEGSEYAGRQVRDFVRGLRGRCDGLVLLLSGGASALCTLPVETLGLAGYRGCIAALLRAGANIHELNTVRKHLDLLKGGRLAAMARQAGISVEAYILSDVLGDDPAVIASGPVARDSTTVSDARTVLGRFGIAGDIGSHLIESPPAAALADVRHDIIANNALATLAAQGAAQELGFCAFVAPAPLIGEAALAGEEAAQSLLRAAPGSALVWGGETIVTVGEERGIGGRNQELALSAALALAGGPALALATLGTDGVDGPTDAAGAVVTGETVAYASAAGLDCGEALRRHDSHGLFLGLERAGQRSLIRTGPTGTNVNDVTIGLRY